MVLYFIRKVHVFLQFSEKEYALLINIFSYQRNHTSFHQNPGQAEHFNAVTVIFNFFLKLFKPTLRNKKLLLSKINISGHKGRFVHVKLTLLQLLTSKSTENSVFNARRSLRRTCYNTTPSWRWMKSVNRRSYLIVWVWLSRELHVSRWLVASF